MKRLKLSLRALLASVLLFANFAVQAAVKVPGPGDEKSLYDKLNLDLPALKSVKKAVEKGDFQKADKELLKYYRNRRGFAIFGLDTTAISITKEEQMMADQSLNHQFFSHKGYQPSYNYGEDIDWRYWPVKDNELRWQLHRHKWFVPLAKAYYLTKDNKYIEAWIEHYTDWIAKNPIDGVERLKAAGASDEEIAAERENYGFAWRPLETSHRLQEQLTEFALTVNARQFTPEYLNLFLRMFYVHADFASHNYSKQGNHLLFEAQRVLFAGIWFPEFKDAAKWRSEAIEILNREIEIQVYDDGMQFELDFGYHVGAIETFLKAYGMARLNGMGDEFPEKYRTKVESMTVATYNLLFPDMSNPMFSDTKLHSPRVLKRQIKSWSDVFPRNRQLPWAASNGNEGSAPDYFSNKLDISGFYILRNGWGQNAAVAIFKAGPPAFWHNQPDNGTFEYWYKGRNFFPDSGSYVYGGDDSVQAQRDWFRQTRVHNTLTLDDRNIEQTDSKLLYWQTSNDGKAVTMVVENPSYEGLAHRRAVFFTGDGVMVIADRASGSASGTVGVHFNLCPGEVEYDAAGLRTKIGGKSPDIRVKTFSAAPFSVVREEGWVSYEYRKKQEREAYAVESVKTSDEDLLFVTVISPIEKGADKPIDVTIESAEADNMLLSVNIGGKEYKLGYKIEK